MEGKEEFVVEGKPFTGIGFVNYSEKQRSAEIKVENGRPDGKFTFWFENGKPEMKGEAHWNPEKKQPVLSGDFKRWYEDGQLEVDNHFKSDGQSDGEQTQYCKDGQKQEVENFSNGKRDGLSQAWNCTPYQLTRSIHFSQGLADGEVATYYEDTGKPQLKGTAKSGHFVGLMQGWYSNGQLGAEGTALDSSKSQTFSASIYFSGVPNLPGLATLTGDYKKWDEKGNPILIGQYDATGKEIGQWQERDVTGAMTVKDYDRAGYVDLKYAAGFAKSLNSGNDTEAAGALYYLQQKLVGANQKLETDTAVGFFGGEFVTFKQNPNDVWPKTQWAYPIDRAPRSLVEPLLAAGAKIDARDEQGRTRLLICASSIPSGRCTNEELTWLISKGADPKAHTLNGENALMLLGVRDPGRSYRRPDPQQEQLLAFATLLKAGVNVNEPDAKGNTLLMLALLNRRSDLAKQLIDNGADVKSVNKQGYSTIHDVFLDTDGRISLGVTSFAAEMVPLLVAHGANIDLPLDWGSAGKLSLRQLALQQGAVQLVQFLEANGAKHD